MSDVGPKGRSVRRHRSICRVHYNLPPLASDTARPLVMPAGAGLQAFRLQVAGHQKMEDTKYLGLLQCNNGTILKPIIKPSQQREVAFYSRLKTTTDHDLIELRAFVPKYYGCREFTYKGFTQRYLILQDLTERMLEPCIMDVKIGKRTWDPLASPEKIKQEQGKYALCKQEYAFCIPGYQVFKLATGKVQKYNKDHGKKLHGQLVRDAFRNFLNGQGKHLCRALILQFLSELWQIQKWSRRQRAARLYCSSLLLVYDAARLRRCCHDDEFGGFRSKCRPQQPVTRRRSIHSLHSVSGSNFSGQLSSKGPVYKKLSPVPVTCMTAARDAFTPPPSIKSPWTDALDRLNQSHSFEHNYEDKLCKIKMNYRALLDQLSSDTPTPNPWGTVKIIDFVHAFFNDDDEERAVDDNFREGVDSLVEIFEEFLRETDE